MIPPHEDLQSSAWLPPPRLQSSEVTDGDRLQVFRNFLKSKCARGSSCKYAHPEPQSMVAIASCGSIVVKLMLGLIRGSFKSAFDLPTVSYFDKRAIKLQRPTTLLKLLQLHQLMSLYKYLEFKWLVSSLQIKDRMKSYSTTT